MLSSHPKRSCNEDRVEAPYWSVDEANQFLPSNATVQYQDGRTTQRVVLVDDSHRCVALTLWGDSTNKLNGKEGSCIVLEDVSTRDYRGTRTLTTLARSRITTMSDEPSAAQIFLQDWWNNTGQDEGFQELALIATLDK